MHARRYISRGKNKTKANIQSNGINNVRCCCCFFLLVYSSAKRRIIGRVSVSEGEKKALPSFTPHIYTQDTRINATMGTHICGARRERESELLSKLKSAVVER